MTATRLAGPSIERTSAERQVLWYGLLAFALTWSAWLPLATDAKGWTAAPFVAAHGPGPVRAAAGRR